MTSSNIQAPDHEFDAASGRLFRHDDAGVTTMFAWPVIQAFRRSARGRTCVACRPEFVILPVPCAVSDTPGLDARTLRAVEAFCATIPAHIRQLVARFPERQWDVLAWVAHAGLAGEELLTSNAAITFALANAGDFLGPNTSARVTATERRVLPYRRQRDILARFGFPTGEHVRKILRHMLPDIVSVRSLTQLRELLSHRSVAERLMQASAIGPNVMAMIENGTIEHVAVAALRRFACADAASAGRDVALQTSHVMRVWGTGPRHVTPPSARIDFPPPPFPGAGHIVPILTRTQLSEEGREQRNCVADCANQMARGRLAVYRVTAPERCTLSLKLRRNHWVIDQLKAAANRAPRPETVSAVREWIARQTSL